MKELHDRVAAEVAQGRRRPGRGARGPARRARARRPRAARRRARRREDAARRRDARARSASSSGALQFTPDMLPADITGTMTLRGGELAFRPGPGVHQRPARRRDQPHAAEDPGRAARGDAGGAGHRRRRAAPAARPVPRARDPEPDRVRGHLPAARGAARPLPRPSRVGYPDARTRSGRCCGSRAAGSRRPRSTTSGRWRAPTTCARRAREVDATGCPTRSSATSSTLVRRTRELPERRARRQPARRRAPARRGQGGGAARGPRLRDARRRRPHGRAACCATGSC